MCDIAIKLERKFNKLTGYQDPYGCGIGGIKKMIFNKNGNTTIQYLDNSLFREYDLYLISTNKIRTSTDILSSINIDSVYPIRNLLEQCDSIISSNVVNLLNESWKLKKQSSKSIIDKELESIESKITELKFVKGYKLCGAGGGGYFLIITEKGIDISNYFDNIIKITVDKNGVETDYL
jgi:D-glycero-alpha-D-manno-heptose-7-phosphate kinase